MRTGISRRDSFGMGAAATAGLVPQANSLAAETGSYLHATNSAFVFREMMMDACATGDTAVA